MNIIRETFIFYSLLLYVCFPFLCWIKFFSDCPRQDFVIWETKKWLLVTLDKPLSYAVKIVWEFAWADSALLFLDKWSSYRTGHLNRFDHITK